MGQGVFSQFAAIPALPFSTSAEVYEYIPPETLKVKQPILDIGGVRGTRSHDSRRVRLGAREVGGDITMPVDAFMLTNWLPRILGAVASGSAFAIAETLPFFQLMIDRVEKVFTYTQCKVSKAVFKGSAGSPFITCTLTIIGEDGSVGASGTFTSTIGTAGVVSFPVGVPYLFEELVLTVGGTTRYAQDFELTIDNVGKPLMVNSFTATQINITDRIVTLAFTNPFEAGSVDLLSPGLPGMSGTLVWSPSGSGDSTTITLPAIQIPIDDPNVQNKDQIFNKITAVCRRTSGAAEIAFTHSGT